MRLGVLIHAESVEPALWPPLKFWLQGRGELAVLHAHADWASPEVAGWLPVLRRHGIALRHHFKARSTQDPALVSITLDALDLAETADLQTLVLVGDISSALPLLDRLRERGLGVIVAGSPVTPLDIRGACTEFLDMRSLESSETQASPGRHRA
jgi:hypothetical protein